MTKLERLKKMIGYLIYTDELSIKSTQSEIAERINANKVSVSRALSGNEEFLTDSFLDRLNRAFGEKFSNEWVKSGQGDMSITAGDINIKSNNQSIGIGVIGKQGDNCQQIHGVSDSTMKDVSKGYQEIIKTYQEQVDRLVSVVDKLTEKYDGECSRKGQNENAEKTDGLVEITDDEIIAEFS